MKDLISAFGMSKQNFYQRLAKLDHRLEEEEQLFHLVRQNKERPSSHVGQGHV